MMDTGSISLQILIVKELWQSVKFFAKLWRKDCVGVLWATVYNASFVFYSYIKCNRRRTANV